MSTDHRSSSPCPTCRAPLADDQRYCLHCGHRRGAPRVDHAAELLAATGEPTAPTAGVVLAAPATVRRPGRRTTTAASAAVLALGLALGAVISPAPAPSSASDAQRVILLADGAATPAPATPAPAAEPAPAVTQTVVETVTTPAPPADVPPPPATTPATTPTTPTTPTPPPFKPPAITHVWVISLAQQDASTLFGPKSPAPYLAQTLAPKGTVLAAYAPVAAGGLANGIALLSGQSPTPETTANCPTYTALDPDTVNATTGFADGTAGCVYPTAVGTLPGQLTTAKRTWRAYVEGQDTTCRHPDLGAADPWATPGPDGYLTARNPFVYFRSILDGPGCAPDTAAQVGLDRLEADLADPSQTPTVSFIVPNAFHDGRVGTAPGGAPTGPADADAFLQRVVPPIMASTAYTDGGLIAIVPDSAAPGAKAPAPSGDGATTAPAQPATGALLLSPYVRTATRVKRAYTPYHLLRSLEDLFALPHLGHAGDSSVSAFDGTVYAKSATTARAARIPTHTDHPSPHGGHVAPHQTIG